MKTRILAAVVMLAALFAGATLAGAAPASDAWMARASQSYGGGGY